MRCANRAKRALWSTSPWTASRPATVHELDGGRAVETGEERAAGWSLSEFLLSTRKLLQPGKVSDDLRTITHRGGREGDAFYRDRWSHDKVVRSTHR